METGADYQVMACAYRKSGQNVDHTIYDPTKPTPVTLSFDTTSTSGEGDIIDSSNPVHRIFCFFHTNGYMPKLPPLGRRFTSVRDVSPATTDALQPYSISTIVANGDSPAD